MNLLKLGKIRFPIPNNININMMPFIIGDKLSIPEEYRDYHSLIEKCPINPNEIGKVGYLSVTESFVKKGRTQRRPGIHTERPNRNDSWGSWGKGSFILDGKINGGLYMSSTIDKSCRAWNMTITEPGHLGDCEHLKSLLHSMYLFEQNELIWMTDSCPHESLPMTKSEYRQWFRFVTSEVSVWYAQHSTPNSLGIMPSCPIIAESKF